MGYRPEIDGLRAIAVIAIVLFHADFPPSGGFLGVDVFFVISGYLICKIISGEIRQQKFSLLHFYERRVRRIIPAHLFVLISTVALATIVLPPQPFDALVKSALSSMGFVANIFFWWRIDYFSEPTALVPLIHTWSLSVEEQFYLFFPPLMIAARGVRGQTLLVIGLGVTSAAAAMSLHGRDPAAVFYLMPFRAWELLAGASVANCELRWGRLRYAGSGLLGLSLIAAALILSEPAKFGMGAAAAVGGTALLLASPEGDRAARWISVELLRRIGLISYSLYLWHQPIFALARNYSMNALTVPMRLLLLALCVVLSIITWVAVEQPFRRTVRLRALIACVLSLSALLSAACGYIIATGGLPERYSDVELAILSANPQRGVAYRDGRPCRRDTHDACVIGDPSRQPSFAVVGDSHAETLTDPLSEVFAKRGLSAYVYTVAGCPFAADVTEIGAASKCEERTRQVLQALREKGIRNVIIHDRSAAYELGAFDNGEGGVETSKINKYEPVGWSGPESQRVAALTRKRQETISQLLDAGIKVYYVLPVPEAGWHVPRALVKAVGQNRLPLTTSLARYEERNLAILQLANVFKNAKGFVPIFPHKVLCDFARCHVHEGKTVFYTDTDHLSREGAMMVVDLIAKAID